MDRWELLDSAPVPGGPGVMRLMRRGTELVIRLDDRELMSNRLHGSEDALSDLCLARLPPGRLEEPGVRVLIGGLGIGFTLATALRRLGPEASVVVAELVPAVTEWNRGPLGEAAGHPILDPRVSMHEGDVTDLIKAPPEPWDAILLDVDNGPGFLSLPTNGWLYGWQGLGACATALRPGGVLGVWSAAPDAAFTRRLQRAGFHVDPVTVRARGAKGGRRHVVWVARSGGKAPASEMRSPKRQTSERRTRRKDSRR